MRLNDTTRYYFEKLASVSSPEEAGRYQALLDPAKSAAVREYLAEREPGHYSMLHTSISPNIITGGYQVNVIPSEPSSTTRVSFSTSKILEYTDTELPSGKMVITRVAT